MIITTTRPWKHRLSPGAGTLCPPRTTPLDSCSPARTILACPSSSLPSSSSYLSPAWIAGIYLIATSRRKVEPGPRCGQCGYNLTGATANRCPECGRPFIEAGIVTNPVTSLRKRRWIGIVLIVVPLIPASLGLATMMFYRARAARQIAATEKAKAAALNKFYTDMLTPVDAGTYPTSAPARSLDQQAPPQPRP